jgi:hypothetical protein
VQLKNLTVEAQPAAVPAVPVKRRQYRLVPEPEYLSVRDACSLLRCSQVLFREHLKAGTGPRQLKTLGPIRFKKTELREWMEQGAAVS